jgi:hypothetical protein
MSHIPTRLLSADTYYDNKHIANKGKRLIYAHDLKDHDDDDFNDAPYEVVVFDIDTSVDTIQAYASNFSP